MKFELSESFPQFFAKHGLIEFEDLLSPKELEELSSKLNEALVRSLNNKPLEISTNQDTWKAGRDLWAQNPQILKLLTKSPIGSVASFLFKKKPLRLAYTQMIFAQDTDIPVGQNLSVSDIGSMTPVLGGALICLQSPASYESEDLLPDLTKPRSGRVIFFSEKQQVPLPSLFAQKGLCCLLLCFAPSKVRYKLQPLDLHTHELKKSGYVFGDLIGEKEAPYLYH